MKASVAASALQVGLVALVVAAGVLGWHALVAGPEPVLHDRSGILLDTAPIWLLPAWYLAAWQALSFASLRRALRGAAALAGLCLLTFAVALLLGVATAGLAALPVGLAGILVIARVMARYDAADAAPAAGAPRWAHLVGVLAGYALLIPALLAQRDEYGREVAPLAGSAGGLVVLLAPLVAVGMPHAALTAWRRAAGRPWPALLPRAAVLALLAWLPGAIIIGPAWPLTMPARNLALHEEIALFRAAGAYWRGAHAGDAMRAAPGPWPVTLVVPEGWLGLEDRYRGPEEVPRSLEIARDPRAPPADPPILRLRLEAPLPVLAAEPGRGVALGCAAPDPARGGLVACRQLAFDDQEGPAPALAAMLPEASLTRRVVLREGLSPEDYLLAGPGLLARCRIGGSCTLHLRVVEGPAALVILPEAAALRWREARDAAARLLHDAAGLQVARDDAPPF
ncbi:hypothetical protein [Roseomonas sp. CECT 9278]|uniref:hypothetical protein n=1 Tax=Roseomonas sp. CECT 9278 TaxID=2845823 RepID=UPI001E65B58D|nr:hypothetical protein [Roseomonas sp. CECT 9278]CAH0143620.1 hypothetical protein ROS9278_00538 [Roseomonas sp. CECT 9278]